MNKIFFYILFFCFLQNCGFTPMYSQNNGNFNFLTEEIVFSEKWNATAYDLFDINNAVDTFNVSNTHSLGQILYTDYIHVFQLSGMILLVAMIGAIVLTFRKREGVKKQSYIKQISRERSEGVQVLEVETNKGVKIDE